MRILMLGNSYIFTNDLPQLLSQLTGAEVVRHTRGGAKLSEQLNPASSMGAKTLKALTEEPWDYVVLQEFSSEPFLAEERFQQSAEALCERIHSIGATPVFYLTWAYQKDGPHLLASGLDYDAMYHGLQNAYRKTASVCHGLIADVGTAFYQRSPAESLYHEDGTHPNMAGSQLAAEILAETILTHFRKKQIPDLFSPQNPVSRRRQS